MAALTNLWNSEKGVLAIALLICATVLTALGHITSDVWVSYTEWIFAFYVGGKTIQGAASAFATRPAAAPAQSSTGPAVAVVNNPPA